MNHLNLGSFSTQGCLFSAFFSSSSGSRIIAAAAVDIITFWAPIQEVYHGWESMKEEEEKREREIQTDSFCPVRLGPNNDPPPHSSTPRLGVVPQRKGER